MNRLNPKPLKMPATKKILRIPAQVSVANILASARISRTHRAPTKLVAWSHLETAVLPWSWSLGKSTASEQQSGLSNFWAGRISRQQHEHTHRGASWQYAKTGEKAAKGSGSCSTLRPHCCSAPTSASPCCHGTHQTEVQLANLGRPWGKVPCPMLCLESMECR